MMIPFSLCVGRTLYQCTAAVVYLDCQRKLETNKEKLIVFKNLVSIHSFWNLVYIKKLVNGV
jgi:hypothetical protein